MKPQIFVMLTIFGMMAFTPEIHSQETGLTKFDRAIDEYVKCTLVSLGDIRTDSLDRGVDFNKDEAINQAIRNCQDEGMNAASILIKEEAEDMGFKYRKRYSNIKYHALPIIERDVRTLLESIS